MGTTADIGMKNKILAAVEQYYFDELLASMHPMLKSIASDKRLFRLTTATEPIQSLTSVFSESYLLLPWQCADILVIPEHELLAISQAYVCLLVAYLILDQMVDGQIPEPLQAAPLVYSHLMMAARNKFEQCLSHSTVFWDTFETYLKTLFNGLAAESASLDQHNPLYTQEVMRQVCHEKTAPFRLAARAMAEVSEEPEQGDLCENLIDIMFLGDQLNDDLLDWQQDFKKGRITYPHLRLMEHNQLSIDDFRALAVDDLRALVEKDRLEVSLLEEVKAIYNSGREFLRKANYPESRFDAIMDERIERSNMIRRRQSTRLLLGSVATRMAKRAH